MVETKRIISTFLISRCPSTGDTDTGLRPGKSVGNVAFFGHFSENFLRPGAKLFLTLQYFLDSSPRKEDKKKIENRVKRDWFTLSAKMTFLKKCFSGQPARYQISVPLEIQTFWLKIKFLHFSHVFAASALKSVTR
jgi:hypothetical protein